MKNAALLLAFSLILLPLGCDLANDPVNLGPSVSGTVLDAATLAPIEGATITIGGRQAASQTIGAYFVPDLPKGQQTLKVVKSGYATYSEDVTIENGLTQKTVKLAK